MSKHVHLVPVDPRGTENRRWRCRHCGRVDSMGDLLRGECKRPFAPSSEESLLDALTAPVSP